MSYISAIETAVPEFCHTQEDLSVFFRNSTNDESIKRKIKVVAEKSGIEKRYSVIPDFSKDPNDFTFFAQNSSLEPAPSLTQRMDLFKENALALSIKAIKKIKNFETIKDSITHVITVTCTGLFAPGLDIGIIRELNLDPTTKRSSINFMGCNAAIVALNSANAICKSTAHSKVLIVCTELCTIHFQKNHSDDYILSTILFGDGSAAILVESDPPALPYFQGIQVKSFNSLIIHKGYNEMAWQITENGFIMNLTSYVSQMLTEELHQFLEAISLDINTVNSWAIHPGGKKILDDFAGVLKLDKKHLVESYDVLKNYGNMSSPTVLFVLKQVIENNKNAEKGNTIFSAAFGPGLSVETMQLEYV